jgi:hypothetical protein
MVDGSVGSVGRLVCRGLVCACLGLTLGSCQSAGLVDRNEQTDSNLRGVASVAGWTRIATTTSYIVVANVLPGEEMFTAAQARAQHPIEGELVLDGEGSPVNTNVRHVEAHIYDRSTGLPVTDLVPTIVLINKTTGERVDVPATLMQDVNLGAVDVHYGNNVAVAGQSEVSVTIGIGDEEVTLSGQID